MSMESTDKELVIWGTALEAVKAMYNFEKCGMKILYFLNSSCNISNFKGYEVFEPSKEVVSGKFIAVATTLNVYMSISETLKSWGLTEFDDFIYYEWIDKKMVLLHGNCYMDYVKRVLTVTKEFTSKYFLYPNPLIHENIGGEISENVLKRVDVWIHQNVTDQNAFSHKLSDTYIGERVKSTCDEVVVPNFTGLVCGMYILCEKLETNQENHFIRNGEDINGMFPFSDRIVEKALEYSHDFNAIYEYCISDNVIHKQDIVDDFNKWIEKIGEREKRWDIKILDYILENYRDKQLFYDINHPTEELMDEVINRILKRLNINEYEKNKEDSYLGVHEIPVYPCVRKALDIKWNKEYIREGIYGKRATDKMDLKEYIREYIWWRHNKIL